MIIIPARCRRSIQNIERQLGDMEQEASNVLKKAINDTAKQAQSSLAKKAKESYTVKISGFKRYMKIKKASKSVPVATITATGQPIPLVHFKFSPAKPDPNPEKVTQIKVKVLKKGGFKKLVGKKEYKTIFFNNIAKRGQVRNRDTKKGKKGSAVIHKAFAQREGKKRLGIHETYGPAIPQMIKSEHVYGKIEPEICENLEKNIQKHIEKVIK